MLTVSEIIKTVDTDEKLFERVEMCLNDFKNNFCRLGFMLRVLKERGYDNAYLMDRFGLSKSTINRSIQINEQFSENGYSYKLDEKYSDFKKSQLIEMLPLSQEQREEVSADMSVADIRDLKNVEDDDYDDVEDDPVEEIEEYDPLPEFDINERMPAIRAALAKTLSEMPEIGRDINKMVAYLESCKDEKISFVVDDYNLYVTFDSSSYMNIKSDEVKFVGYGCCIHFYSFPSYSEVMEYSDCAYYSKIDRYSVSKLLVTYILDHFDDWEYVKTDLGNVSKMLVNIIPLEFELNDKYLVRVEGLKFVFSYLHYDESKEYGFDLRLFDWDLSCEFYKRLDYLFLTALADNLKDCTNVYKSEVYNLYICDKNNRLNFMFNLEKDNSIELCFGLSGSDFEGFLLEEIEFCDCFSQMDDSAIDMFFLLCTGKRVQYAIDTYWKSENADK